MSSAERSGDGSPGPGPAATRSRRDFLKGAGGLGASLALLGSGGVLLEACGSGGSGGSSSSGTPRKGGHVTEGWAFDIKTFNSTLSQDVYSNLVLGLCFDALLTSDAKGNLLPAIAQSVPQAASDGATYTFKLRKDVKWSDGKQLTSDDVLFTYNLMFAPEYTEVNSPRRGDLTQHLASITAPDPYTIVFKTKGVFAPFLTTHGQYGILPKHILGSLPAAAINSADFNSAPTVVNGVFKFVRWDKGAQVLFERNDGYYRGASRLDRFVYKVLSNTTAVANQLKTGEIDMGNIDPSQWDSMHNVEGVNLISYGQPAFQFYAYQLDPAKPASALFSEKAVRQALYYALDRPSMIKTIYFNTEILANSPEPPTSWAYDPNVKPTYNYDPNKANSLLDQAGWQKGSDGIRSKNGHRLAFTITTANSVNAWQSLIQVMQQQWKAVGADVSTKLVTFPALVNVITTTRDFDIFLVGFNWGQDPDQAQLFSSAGTAVGGFNGFDFKNPDVDKALADATTTVDHTKRKQLYATYQNLMADLVPAPILFFNKALYGLNQRVKGYGLGTFNQYAQRPWMKDVWVSDGK